MYIYIYIHIYIYMCVYIYIQIYIEWEKYSNIWISCCWNYQLYIVYDLKITKKYTIFYQSKKYPHMLMSETVQIS